MITFPDFSVGRLGIRFNEGFELELPRTEDYSRLIWFNSQHIPAWLLARDYAELGIGLNKKSIELTDFLRLNKVFLK